VHSPEEDQQARRVLEEYPDHLRLPKGELQPIYGGFSGALIWRIVSDCGMFALRRWPHPGLPRGRIIGLHRLLEHVQSFGISFVAIPRRTRDGRTLIHFEDHDWQLESWLPGVADFHSFPSTERLLSSMTALSEWHRTAEHFVPDRHSAYWFLGRISGPSPAVMERLATLQAANQVRVSELQQKIQRSWNTPFHEPARRILDLFRGSQQAIMRELTVVRDVHFRLQPCLRDISHDHLLYTNHRVTGLVDPSACRIENVASDLSRLIGSMVKDDFLRWNTALSEYQQHLPLTTRELGLVALLDRSGVLLSGWTWLEWIFLRERVFRDSTVVLKRLQEITERMARLTDGATNDSFKSLIR